MIQHTVPIGDAAAIARAIDSARSAIPEGQRGTIILNMSPDRAALFVVWRVGSHGSLLMRIEKERGKQIGGDLSVAINFAKSEPAPPEPFTYGELYAALRQGNGPITSGIAALKLYVVGAVELAEVEIGVIAPLENL